MGIIIKEIRIRNFRSYQSADITLSENCVLIGANNVGKTTLLQAIQVAFLRGIRVSEEDIYVELNELLPKSRKAIIDVLIVPVEKNEEGIKEFDEKWFEHIGELRSEDTVTLDQFLAIRTIISYNPLKGEYDIERKALIDWPTTEAAENYNEYKKNRITDKVLQALPVFYMDAKRDISVEMKDRNSYWGKLVRDVGLDSKDIEDIETTLDTINNEIIHKSPILKHLTDNLSKVSRTVSTSDSSIKINPVSRKIKDLNRGIDLTFKDEHSERFPISNHGMGTRSWITFLTVVAYISWKIEQMEKEEVPFHPIMLLEEPEAHLHPQAQRKIFQQINDLSGQKIVSTHSPMIVGQVDINDIRHISKIEGKSNINFINTANLEGKDIRKIKFEILKSRGDLLFANAILLCEGETEEQAIPTFFKEYFHCEAFEAGINIISVGGSGKYKPFLRIAKDLNMKVYILSDGEPKTIKEVRKLVKAVYDEDEIAEISKGIKFLPDGSDFEKYLINAGYAEEISIAMTEILGDGFLEQYISAKGNTSNGSRPTKDKCDTCNQFIYEKSFRDYSNDDGRVQALLDCIHDNKTAYSSIIASTIIYNRQTEKIPPMIEELFIEIENDFKILIQEDEAVNI
ncbi:ATP-dependent nuclease [Litchfieldia salsa]|uniref:Putative ATP-dependent endonuclease of the OLD family n=1 Tax=Litchfieldia salsa TaxID=930152 RepID=A0A1H0PPP1_9BACI|nr:AAA family ATPase [Litchfieldia salsa]SDP06615.1 putative ATP-dependent endonuclease of the OLD family [Litchfieldia salsa]